MGVRENKVETYLNDEVESVGGMTRKWVSPGRDGVPDRIVIIPVTAAELIERLSKVPGDTLVADFKLVEVKTVDGKLSSAQRREIGRLINIGCDVSVVYGNEDVDAFMRRISDVTA